MPHSEALSLLPWFANGTLSQRERLEVQRHLTVCPDCRDELERFAAIRDAVTDDAPAVNAAPGDVDRLLVKLAKRERQSADTGRTTRTTSSRWWAWFADGWFGRPAWQVAVPLVLVLVVVGGVVRFGFSTDPATEYRTLSNDAGVEQQPMRIRLTTRSELSPAAMKRLLVQADVEGRAEVAGRGVYDLILDGRHSPAEVMGLLEVLQAQSEVKSAKMVSSRVTDSPDRGR